MSDLSIVAGYEKTKNTILYMRRLKMLDLGIAVYQNTRYLPRGPI